VSASGGPRAQADALHAIIVEGDLLTSDGFKAAADADDKLLYWHRSLLFRNGDWRGEPAGRLVFGSTPLRGRTLIVGHSDEFTGRTVQAVLKLAGLKALWGTNLEQRPPFSHVLPLGLTNNCDDTPLHRVLGDPRHLATAFANTPFPPQYSGTVYACFSTANAPAYRSGLEKLVREQPGFVWSEPTLTAEGRVDFLARLRTYDFVLCPRGNGIDTHRLWETLYMGGIPVVRRSESFPAVLTDLPVLVVDDWVQLLDPEFRERSWNELQDRPMDPLRLRLTVWVGRIRESSNDV
jgi:hypothetical protein